MRARVIKWTAAWLAVGMLLGSCQNAPQQIVGSAEVSEWPELPAGDRLKSAFTDKRLPGMIGLAESQSLRLYVNKETAEIAVVTKKGGTVWRSNPEDRAKDALASGVNKDMLSAQTRLSFYNAAGQSNSVNSYTDSAAHKQIRYEQLPQGVRVHYQFGSEEASIDDLPVKISKERFETKLLAAMDKAGQRALKIGYAEDKEAGVYVRIDKAMQGIQLSRALEAFASAGYTEEDLQLDNAEHGVETESGASRQFRLTIEYQLDGDDLRVRVPAADIRFPDAYPIHTLSLLDYFGAAGSGEEGAIFVPDGSGALIRFNNGKTRYPAYQQDVYGPDLTLQTEEPESQEQKARMPVFGMIRKEGAMLGIIEEGAAAAAINADVAGKLNSYNAVYPSFYVVNKSDITLQSGDMVRTLPKFQKRPTSSDFAVRYTFTGADNASYSGLAELYRTYLEKQGGLPKITASASESKVEAIPFYLKLIGGVTTKKHRLGIPYEAEEALTTFDQAQEILTKLEENQVKNIRLRYSGWFNGGLNHRHPDRVKVDQSVGGAKGLTTFAEYAKQAGITLFPDMALLTVHDASGFKPSREASRTLTQEPAKLYPTNLAIQERDAERSPSYVLSPNLMYEASAGMLDTLKRYGTAGLSLRDLGEQLNSDMSPKKLLDRPQAQGEVKRTLERFKQEGLELAAEGGNAYIWPYVSDLTDAPMSSSRFKLEDEEIPFYQLVVHGAIGYAGAPYNLSAQTNPRHEVLKLIEYGASPYFTWFYAPNHAVKETDYEDLYAAHYEPWLETAAELYREVNEANGAFAGQRMTHHEQVQEGVYRTTYESGSHVLVNYNEDPVVVDGLTVAPGDYAIGGERP
ncbi:hypothetical protein B9G55_03005 [Saccharibacillus sp. O16]|nr:hypothetical protein B9G55_03005 [Saccharibacillus sp. O16]